MYPMPAYAPRFITIKAGYTGFPKRIFQEVYKFDRRFDG